MSPGGGLPGRARTSALDHLSVATKGCRVGKGARYDRNGCEAVRSMSRSTKAGSLERIDRIGHGEGADLMSRADHIDRAIEQRRDIALDPRIFPHADRCIGGKIDENIDVAVGAVVPPRPGPEQRGMADAARLEPGFVFLTGQGSLVSPQWHPPATVVLSADLLDSGTSSAFHAPTDAPCRHEFPQA